MTKYTLSLCTAVFYALFAFGQQSEKFTVKWSGESSEFKVDNQKVNIPSCQSCAHAAEKGQIPYYVGRIKLPKGYTTADASINVSAKEPFKGDLGAAAPFVTDAYDSFNWKAGDARTEQFLLFEFPALHSPGGGQVEKITEFEIIFSQSRISTRPKAASFTQNSVLSQGDWYRIGVVEDGVYTLDRQDLIDLGVDMSALDPQSINIYGNGYGQLPLDNSVDRPDDLLINNIYIKGENDNVFDSEDYILFYGKGPHKWVFNEVLGLFDHQKHQFTDTSYYFIGVNTGDAPSRIPSISSSGSSPNYTVNDFNDFVFHEADRENMIKSGSEWYGEKFDVQTTYVFTGEKFTFPNLLPETETVVRTNLISRSTVGGPQSTFTLGVNAVTASTGFGSVGTSSTAPFARSKDLEVRLTNASPTLNITLAYSKNAPSAAGWLNWINVNTRRQLRMAGSQMIFRDINTVGPGRTSRFQLTNASNIQEVWDVTEPSNVQRITYERTGSQLQFTRPTEVLREFVAFTPSNFLQPGLFGRVENQNLHALGLSSRVDMVIVSPGRFRSKAEELADLHRNYEFDPLNVEVVSLGAVYNEFSSGMRDITAIKWLMKMLYDRANGSEELMPRYLLLFGDGSYDNRNFTPGNTNLIPTYQSENSLNPVSSHVSDDYFAFLSDDESDGRLDQLDVGVGRLVVKNINEATSVVNKIRRYMEVKPATFEDECTVCGDDNTNRGDWRNAIALVADDEDGNDHMRNSRTISEQINDYTKDYNIERIFSDAFPQDITPGGARYPAVNEAIDRRVRKGAFVVNYIGHGGELGWAQERILDVPTILSWDNGAKLPVFMTATCEFTRFDDPLRTSAGEYVLLNGNGGGIALMTTTRLVYSGPNFLLTSNFYDALLDRPEDEVVTRLGDISRITKNNAATSASSNHRNFSLVGDPALPLAIPKQRIEITSITDTIGNPVDTLKALGVARVQGEVRGVSGTLNPNFNGVVSATVYDRIETKTTFANDGGNPFTFPTQENIVYRGNAEVTNGQFQFDFVIPKDISFAVDTTARISLYGISELQD
ncbi:MAG TPA: type IX secretion system sortase PorU, partial [Cryomorphaceae bacterium]|nr:type IX secretion system sortase PorU [Cryomorphaceae bacterium]